MEAYGKEIENFNAGKLSNTFSNSTFELSSSLLDLEYKIPGVSFSSKLSVIKSKIIKFGRSNEKADAGQSFVPYFDGSEVTTENKVPLSGIELIHFSDDHNYAGYIKPNLITFDVSKLINFK